jgi:hypothetical protein
MVLYICKKERLKKIMKKLNLQEKELVVKKYGRLGYLVIHEIEKLKLNYGTLEETMEVAYDYICDKAE